MTGADEFALLAPHPVRVEPCVSPYRAANDLRDVINGELFDLSFAQREALIENSFVVAPRFHKQLFNAYIDNKDKGYPSFVTADALHNIEDRMRVARGCVFSYYEFLRPPETRRENGRCAVERATGKGATAPAASLDKQLRYSVNNGG